MIGINFRAINSFDINPNQAKTPSEKNNLAILDYFMIQIKNMRIWNMWWAKNTLKRVFPQNMIFVQILNCQGIQIIR